MLRKVKKQEKIYIEDNEENLILTTEVLFDRKEQIILERSFFSSGKILIESEYEYDGTLLVREKVWNELGGWTEVKYSYNEKNQLIYSNTATSIGEQEIYERVFQETKEIVKISDSEGNIQKRILLMTDKETKQFFYENGKLVEEQEYFYDSKENLIRKTTHYLNEFEEMETLEYNYEYDSRQNVISELESKENGTILYKKEYFYNKDVLIREIDNNFEGSHEIIVSTYEYDKSDRLIKFIAKSSLGRIIYQELNIYNKDGTVVQRFIMEEFQGRKETNRFRREIEFYEA